MKMGWLLLVFLVLLNGCVSNNQTLTECSKDADCGVGGCSGQICGVSEKVKDLITTCEFLEEYKCLELSNCGCIEGKCGWENNEDYRNCLEEVRT